MQTQKYNLHRDVNDEDKQLRMLDLPLCDSDSSSDEYYSNYELETESLMWKHISSPWYHYLFEGIKTWDVRLQKNDWKKINIGDTIMYCGEVENQGKVCCMKVMNIKKFNSFSELIKKVPLQKILPYIRSDKDAISLFRIWYSEEDEKKYGVIAINLRRADL